jgi:hypothetical protein
MQTRFVRGLAVYLSLALLPTPFVVSWLITAASSASAVDEEDTRQRTRPPSLTDLAPPQERLVVPASEGPKARLQSLGLVPQELSPDELQERFGPRFENAAEAREFQVSQLARQLKSRARAEAVLSESERPLAGTPPLHPPTSTEPRVPDPFVRLPARVADERADQALDRR